jgi:hypothetical protein
MTFGGILCGNEVAIGMPVDDMVGSLWGYVWGPEAGGATTPRSTTNSSRWRKASRRTGVSISATSPASSCRPYHGRGHDRCGQAVEAFEGHNYDAGKKTLNYWRKCDHQAVQQTYAGEIVPKAKRRSETEYFTVIAYDGRRRLRRRIMLEPGQHEGGGDLRSQTIPARADYTAVTTKYRTRREAPVEPPGASLTTPERHAGSHDLGDAGPP